MNKLLYAKVTDAPAHRKSANSGCQPSRFSVIASVFCDANPGGQSNKCNDGEAIAWRAHSRMPAFKIGSCANTAVPSIT